MKNLFPSFSTLLAVAASALMLSSCNRAEYAMLPKGSSYLGSTRVATPVPATPAPVVAATPAVTSPTPAATAPITVAATPEAVVTPAPTAAAPITPAAQPKVATAPATPAPAAATVATTTAPKLNLMQRVALSKVVRKMDKLAQKSGVVQKHENTAATQKLAPRLRQAILFAAIGLLLEILGAIIGSWVVYLIGAILIIVGAVFFIIWLVDTL